jgi:D-alanyl-D-alanine carboxypeptidase/D-alanyl-D-alanine-endopeptidase (penicillin-binding protein 4)
LKRSRNRSSLTRRGRVALRTVATVMLVVGLACIGTTVRAGASDDDVRPAARTTYRAAPLLSPRRLPSLFTDIIAAQQLQTSVDAAFANWDACIAIDGQGRALARHAADHPLAPASTQKLLTTAAALAVLGPDHRFTTRVVSAAPVDNGTVRGDLYVVGGGDPMLATPGFVTAMASEPLTAGEPLTPLADLADAIVAAGVTHVDGALIGDDHRHDTLRFLPSWKPNYRTDGEVGALSALAVDHGFAAPGSAAVPDDPPATAAARLAELLAARGVTIGAGTASGTAPAGARDVAQVESPPLADIAAATLSASDNFAAELLAREVGVAVAHDGSTAAGTAAIVTTLRDRGVDTDGVTLLDGSGLAPGNRVTCDALVGVVDLARSARFTALDRGLAVAGESGTLALRFRGDPLQGVLRAKTGHINGVAGLAGVVDDAEHLRFAFIVNGQFTTAQGQELQATAARLVAAYPQVPAGTTLPGPSG